MGQLTIRFDHRPVPVKATITGGIVSCAKDLPFEALLKAYSVNSLEPLAYHPDYDLAIADAIAKDFHGVVVDNRPPDPPEPEETVY